MTRNQSLTLCVIHLFDETIYLTSKQGIGNLTVFNVIHTGQGYCFNGDCPTLTMQCEAIWGYGGTAADQQCYDQFNTKGSINGHCGVDVTGHYKKCDLE